MPLLHHFVASAFIYDKGNDKFLLILHKKLGKWVAPGGHIEADEMPHITALREVNEELGVNARIINLLDQPDVATPNVPQLPNPFCILLETIPAWRDEEEHMHVDFIYVVEEKESGQIQQARREIAGAQWFSAEEISRLDTFENIKTTSRAISEYSKAEINT